MRRADRLFQIIQVLRRTRKPLTADAIAAELKIEADDYRDIATLIGQRVPIRGEAGMGYILEKGFDLPPLMLTPDEIEAAVLGAQWVAGHADAVLARAAEDLMAKIADTVPERLRPFVLESGFPYVTSVGTFWRGYAATWSASHTRYPTSVGDHVMLGVIGLSTALEYGLKGLYENTIGRLFELNRPDGGTAEEKYAARVADEYAKLIVEKGWYEFGFAHALKHLWTDVPFFGPGLLRKWERRVALSGEYAIKAVYATLIGIGTSSAYDADVTQRYAVVAGWSDSLSGQAAAGDSALRAMHRVAWLDRRYALLTVPRYTPYRDALLALSRHATRVRVAEISANRIVTFTGTAPREWSIPSRATEVVAYVAPADPQRVRVVLAVDARDLLDVLAAAQRDGLVVDHIYDY